MKSMRMTAIFGEIEVKADCQEVLKYIKRVKEQRGKETEILCGYEAGCLGYSLLTWTVQTYISGHQRGV